MDPVPFYMAPQEYNPAIPIAYLHEHPENYNQGNMEAIASSLDAHGFYGAVLVQKSTGMIVAGNHRFREARQKGATTLPGFLLDIDDDEARDILADDNHTTSLAMFDEDKLITLLEKSKMARGRLPSTYGEGELSELLKRQQERRGEIAGPAAPDEFGKYDDDIETEYRCPHCGYEWSGDPAPETGATEGKTG